MPRSGPRTKLATDAFVAVPASWAAGAGAAASVVPTSPIAKPVAARRSRVRMVRRYVVPGHPRGSVVHSRGFHAPLVGEPQGAAVGLVAERRGRRHRGARDDAQPGADDAGRPDARRR